MTRPFVRLAWAAAAATYLLIVLGAVVRITGSGMGCGDDWPLCHGRLVPLFDLPTFIEWSHRLVAAIVSALVVATAVVGWRGAPDAIPVAPRRAAYWAVALLVIQVLLGAVTVKLELPPWTVILHLGTAMLLFAALLVAARGSPVLHTSRFAWGAVALSFVTVLFGALTANLGAASACLGFPLCNGQVIPEGNYLQAVHWIHRLLAYGLTGYVVVWAWRRPSLGPRVVLALVVLQVALAAVMVVSALPQELQAAHVAVGTAIWGAVVVVATRNETAPEPETSGAAH